MSARNKYSFYLPEELVDFVDEKAREMTAANGFDVSRNKVLEQVLNRLRDVENITGEDPLAELARWVEDLRGNGISVAA